MKTDETFLDSCYTPMYRVFSDIYNTVLRKNTNPKYILREFQVAISQVHKWTVSKKNIEFDKANELDKRISSLIRANMRTTIKKTISPERVKYAMEELPDASNFYHLCLVEISRELYRYPSLMYHNVDTFTRRKNRENIKDIVYGAIDKTLISVIPVLSDTESDEDTEVNLEEKNILNENDDENDEEIINENTDEPNYENLLHVNDGNRGDNIYENRDEIRNVDRIEISNENSNEISDEISDENHDESHEESCYKIRNELRDEIRDEFHEEIRNEIHNEVDEKYICEKHDEKQSENKTNFESENSELNISKKYNSHIETTEANSELETEKKNFGITDSYGNSFDILNSSLEIYRKILECDNDDIYQNETYKNVLTEPETTYEDSNNIRGGSLDNEKDKIENSNDYEASNIYDTYEISKDVDGICNDISSKPKSLSPCNISSTGDVIIDVRDVSALNTDECTEPDYTFEKKNNYLCMKSLSELMRNGSGSATSTKKRFDEYSHLSYEAFSKCDATSDIKLEDETNSSDSNSEDIGVF
jgi:hypothetical protein